MSDIIVLGPVAYRAFSLPRECDANQGHAHNYDHITIVQAGAVKVFWRPAGDEAGPERESKVFRAGEFFLVRAEVEHRIKALAPDTRYACVFTHRDFDEGAVVQEYNGHPDAYV
jgi:quercetin dioxygenase-like cupin family protein